VLVLWTVVAGLFGLAIGSFLNVVIYRVPAGLSVVHPPSACPSCGHEIRNRHNVPVLGWLVLRGRCYDCKAKISPRYPLVELATGLFSAATTARLLHDKLEWLVPAYLYLVCLCIVGGLIALDRQAWPKSMAGISYLVVYALLVLAAATEHQWWGLGRAGIATVGLAILGLFLFRDRASVSQDARELAQVAAAPLAFHSWWLLGYAALLAVAGVVIGRRVPAATWIAAGTLLAVLVPTP